MSDKLQSSSANNLTVPEIGKEDSSVTIKKSNLRNKKKTTASDSSDDDSRGIENKMPSKLQSKSFLSALDIAEKTSEIEYSNQKELNNRLYSFMKEKKGNFINKFENELKANTKIREIERKPQSDDDCILISDDTSSDCDGVVKATEAKSALVKPPESLKLKSESNQKLNQLGSATTTPTGKIGGDDDDEIPLNELIKREEKKVPQEKETSSSIATEKKSIGESEGEEDEPLSNLIKKKKQDDEPKDTQKQTESPNDSEGFDYTTDTNDAFFDDDEYYSKSRLCQYQWCICDNSNITNETSKMCDICQQWYHRSCLGGDARKKNDNEDFICPVCLKNKEFIEKYKDRIQIRKNKFSCNSSSTIHNNDEDADYEDYDLETSDDEPKKKIAARSSSNKIDKKSQLTQEDSKKTDKEKLERIKNLSMAQTSKTKMSNDLPETHRIKKKQQLQPSRSNNQLKTVVKEKIPIKEQSKIVTTSTSSINSKIKSSKSNNHCIICKKNLPESNTVPKTVKLANIIASDQVNNWKYSIYCDDTCIRKHVDAKMDKEEGDEVYLLDSETKTRNKLFRRCEYKTKETMKQDILNLIYKSPRFYILDAKSVKEFKKTSAFNKSTAPGKSPVLSASLLRNNDFLGGTSDTHKQHPKPSTVTSGVARSSTINNCQAFKGSDNESELDKRNKNRESIAKKFADRIKDSEEFKSFNTMQLAEEIETTYWKQYKFKDYIGKLRPLLQNICQPENNFYLKILRKEIKPADLPQMSSADMASDELKKQREEQKKTDLEIRIKFSNDLNEQKLKTQIKKTHKGDTEFIDVNMEKFALDENSSSSSTSTSSSVLKDIDLMNKNKTNDFNQKSSTTKSITLNAYKSKHAIIEETPVPESTNISEIRVNDTTHLHQDHLRLIQYDVNCLLCIKKMSKQSTESNIFPFQDTTEAAISVRMLNTSNNIFKNDKKKVQRVDPNFEDDDEHEADDSLNFNNGEKEYNNSNNFDLVSSSSSSSLASSTTFSNQKKPFVATEKQNQQIRDEMDEIARISIDIECDYIAPISPTSYQTTTGFEQKTDMNAVAISTVSSLRNSPNCLSNDNRGDLLVNSFFLVDELKNRISVNAFKIDQEIKMEHENSEFYKQLKTFKFPKQLHVGKMQSMRNFWQNLHFLYKELGAKIGWFRLEYNENGESQMYNSDKNSYTKSDGHALFSQQRDKLKSFKELKLFDVRLNSDLKPSILGLMYIVILTAKPDEDESKSSLKVNYNVNISRKKDSLVCIWIDNDTKAKYKLQSAPEKWQLKKSQPQSPQENKKPNSPPHHQTQSNNNSLNRTVSQEHAMNLTKDPRLARSVSANNTDPRLQKTNIVGVTSSPPPTIDIPDNSASSNQETNVPVEKDKIELIISGFKELISVAVYDARNNLNNAIKNESKKVSKDEYKNILKASAIDGKNRFLEILKEQIQNNLEQTSLDYDEIKKTMENEFELFCSTELSEPPEEIFNKDSVEQSTTKQSENQAVVVKRSRFSDSPPLKELETPALTNKPPSNDAKNSNDECLNDQSSVLIKSKTVTSESIKDAYQEVFNVLNNQNKQDLDKLEILKLNESLIDSIKSLKNSQVKTLVEFFSVKLPESVKFIKDIYYCEEPLPPAHTWQGESRRAFLNLLEIHEKKKSGKIYTDWSFNNENWNFNQNVLNSVSVSNSEEIFNKNIDEENNSEPTSSNKNINNANKFNEEVQKISDNDDDWDETLPEHSITNSNNNYSANKNSYQNKQHSFDHTSRANSSNHLKRNRSSSRSSSSDSRERKLSYKDQKR